MIGWVAKGLGMIVFVLGVMTARVLWSSRQALAEADTRAGKERLLRLGEAARLYAPGNPWSRRALQALVDEGRAGSLPAWREVRSAILATRSFYTPHLEILVEADQRIAELSAAGEPGSREANIAWHKERLSASNADAPSPLWSFIAILGLFGWLGGALGFFTLAVGEDDRLRPRPAILWAVSIAAGLTLFYLGLARA